MIFLLSSMMEAKVKILPEELLPPKPFHLFTCPKHIVSSANQSLALLRSCENELQTISPERLQSLQKNITVRIQYATWFQQTTLIEFLQLAQSTIPLCQVPLWSFGQIDFVGCVCLQSIRIRKIVHLQHKLREKVKKEQQFKSFSGSENTAKLPNDIVSKLSKLFLAALMYLVCNP